MNRIGFTSLKLVLLVLFALAALFFGVAVGSVSIPFSQICSIVVHKLFDTPLPESITGVTPDLVWNIRLPRVLLAFIVGAALSVCGAVMQSMLQNPLASSYGLGVSSGAGVAVALCMIFGLSQSSWSNWLMPLICLGAALCTILLVMTLSQRIDPSLSNQTIILVGMVLSLFLSACMSTLATSSPDHSQRILSWQLGSFSMKSWNQVVPLAPVVLVGSLLLWRFGRELDLLSFGDESATTLGLSTKRFKWMLLFLISLLTGASVAFVGIIGFVDLVTPHIVRRFLGPSHRLLIPGCVLFGGGFMVCCDLAARTLTSPSEIPIGSITALLGAPFFLYLFLASRNKGQQM